MTTRPECDSRTGRRHSTARRAIPAMGAGVAALLALGACSSASDAGAGVSSTGSASAPSSSSGGSPGQVSGTVTVFAAASLKESFTALGDTFEKTHPGTEVTFSFGGSDTLAASITSGAPADVFASASPGTMATVIDAGDTAGTPTTFVRNQLEIATLPGNPDRIASLKDLTRPGLTVVLCDRTVPCGAAAQKALTVSGLTLTPASYEQDVKSALNKVVLKEADAAVVYKTDVTAAGDTVQGVDFPESAQAVNDYPITLLKEAHNADAGRAFIELVMSPEGRKVLTEAGFRTP